MLTWHYNIIMDVGEKAKAEVILAGVRKAVYRQAGMKISPTRFFISALGNCIFYDAHTQAIIFANMVTCE